MATRSHEVTIERCGSWRPDGDRPVLKLEVFVEDGRLDAVAVAPSGRLYRLDSDEYAAVERELCAEITGFAE